MVKLNDFAFDIKDAKLLEGTFKQIKNKEDVILITDTSIKKTIFSKVANNLTIPNGIVSCSFQNLFKFSIKNKEFYIGQILLDYGFPIGNHSSQTFDRKYYFQIAGFAYTSIDFGRTVLRPENKLDKLTWNFFDKDIDLEGLDKFSSKYYLESNKKDLVKQYFTEKLTSIIHRNDKLILSIHENELSITFCDRIKPNQMRVLEQIFCLIDFIAENPGA